MLNPVRSVTFPQRLKENTPPLTQQAALGSAVLSPVLTSLTDPAANPSLGSRGFPVNCIRGFTCHVSHPPWPWKSSG